jgi:Fe-S cluster biogenesis protein NfuA
MIAEFNSKQDGDNAAVEAILSVLRPAMEADGGGIDLVAVEGGRVDVRLKGLCLDCPSASLTLRLGVERTIKERLPWVNEVRRVG